MATDTAAPVPGRDHYVVTRTIDAPRSAVFALLADPASFLEESLAALEKAVGSPADG